MQWATRQRCGKGTLARPDGIPTLARGNEKKIDNLNLTTF